MMVSIKTKTFCPTCGAECSIGGDDKEGTHYYIPISKDANVGELKKQLVPCRHYGKESGHYYKKVCDDCYRERFFAADELLQIRDREIIRLKEQNKKMREGINKCLDHWAIVTGPSVYERSTMRVLLENALFECKVKK